MKIALAVFALACASAGAQDPGMMAAQQAAQQAMQASQQATQQALQDMQTAQQANQQAMQAAMQANNWTQGYYQSFPFPFTGVLSLSVPPGTVKPGTRVRIDLSAERDAKVYYTTDGWTPTTSSTLYTGPIRIDASTHLEAVAAGPGLPHALLIRADYTVNGAPQQPAPNAALFTNGVLPAETPLRLVTASTISSATAHAGDKIAILLDLDVKIGDSVVAAKGTPADAQLTLVVPARNGAAGRLAFEVHSLTLPGLTIPLAGSELLEGGVAKDAVIEPGKALTARVARETRLNP
jgi:type II secretory pathway pseudopilin PulG